MQYTFFGGMSNLQKHVLIFSFVPQNEAHASFAVFNGSRALVSYSKATQAATTSLRVSFGFPLTLSAVGLGLGLLLSHRGAVKVRFRAITRLPCPTLRHRSNRTPTLTRFSFRKLDNTTAGYKEWR